MSATIELLGRGLAGLDGTQASLEASEVALEVRSRLIAWLVTSGAEPLSSIVALFDQAHAVFVPTIHAVTPQDVLDVQLLVAYLLQQLDDASRLYRWDAEGWRRAGGTADDVPLTHPGRRRGCPRARS